MTRRQYELMKQRRRRQTIIGISVIAAVAILLTVILVIALQPKPKPNVIVSATPTPAPEVTEAPIMSDPEPQDVAPVDVEPIDVEPQDVTPVDTEPQDVPDVTEITEPDDQGGELPAVVTEIPVVPSVTTTVDANGLRSVRFRVTGDIMVTDEQLAMAKAMGNGNGYDFTSSFSLIGDSLRNADYTMGNLETTIGKYNGKAYSGYPMFNSPETLLLAMKDAGYDFVTLANNHMLDRWFDGMKNTVEWVERAEFGHVGAYRTQEERNTPVIYEIGGIKFGFVAYTHTTNTMERACSQDAQIYGVPYLYKSDIAGDIRKLREAGAEVVIAFPHWGDEYVREPDSNQQKYAWRLATSGADIILGSHSHMVQQMANAQVTNEDGSVRDVFCIFSLGNFLSSHTVQYTDAGIIVEFTVQEQPDGSFATVNIGYIPTYCWIHDNQVQILSSAKYYDNPPAGMSDSAYRRMRESFNEIVTMMGDNYRLLVE